MIILFLAFVACGHPQEPSKKVINELNLKRGEVPTCGAPERKLGSVALATSCSEAVKTDFDLALALLHSFEYDEAEKAFARVIDKEPACAMAYWGVAMSNFHPLWSPPLPAELEKGLKAVRIGQSLPGKSTREAAYLGAISAFFTDYDKAGHQTRSLRFEKAMERLYTGYPEDKEAAIFYALALNAAADPADKSYSRQKKAGDILNRLYAEEPNHPGIVHYIIHTYDSPELARQALPAARRYASVAPSSAHALHMPSHIFTRLGFWEESIHSNLASVASAQCYAEAVGIKGHWDEELHGLDYLVYAYLQQGRNDLAKGQWDYLRSMEEVEPVNFKVAYAFASIPSRYLLENRLWKEAAALKSWNTGLSWEKFPWEGAILQFTRLLGSVNTGDIQAAEAELADLREAHEKLLRQKDAYKANQVEIQIKASEAWILLQEGQTGEALARMTMAADMEDKTAKHPVTPCEVLPARELLGDLLLRMNEPEKAFTAYEADLKKNPNRFNSLYGAGLAAERSGRPEKARYYYGKLLDQADANSGRSEVALARNYLKAELALK